MDSIGWDEFETNIGFKILMSCIKKLSSDLKRWIFSFCHFGTRFNMVEVWSLEKHEISCLWSKISCKEINPWLLREGRGSCRWFSICVILDEIGLLGSSTIFHVVSQRYLEAFYVPRKTVRNILHPYFS